MIEEFKKYVQKFNFEDEQIRMKYDHSLRVQSLCQMIAITENLSQTDIELAKVIGLLHDHGRFKQWEKYHTFDDAKSIDHAKLGIEELFDTNEIQKYWSNEKDYQKIKDAIFYHNKYQIESSKETEEMCKIIRDADKLDILYLCSINVIKLSEQGNITPKVKDTFYSHKLVNSLDRKAPIDQILSKLAFVYDLNYKESFVYLKNYNIINQIFEYIQNKKELKPYFDEINSYIESKIKQENTLIEFQKYVRTFDCSDKNIIRKYYHSLRVKNLAKIIAKHIGLNNEDIKIAETAGLLHDYGRFMQWTKYHTYNDQISVDHADYAVKELFENGELAKFWNQIKDNDELYDAIKYHNKITIPDHLSKHNKKICKIIRDADKLDILYLYTCGSLTLPEDGDISPKVKRTFDSKQSVDKKDEQSGADHTLTVLALVYDINFNISFVHLKKYNIINQIFENVTNKEKFKPYFDEINNYINKKIKEGEENVR